MTVGRAQFDAFSDPEVASLSTPMKIGVLGTISDEGLPHLTLISTLQPNSATQLTWGQFTEGLSKAYVQANPKSGFLIMTQDKSLWRGKANFSHTARSGPEFDMYNLTPMFRYNAYFGIHTVFYMDLVEHYGRETLAMLDITKGALLTAAARALAPNEGAEPVLNTWTQGLLNKASNLKFLCYVGRDGYPMITPVIQARALDSEHIIFSLSSYGEELRSMSPSTPVALFAMSMDMEDVLLRGTYQGEASVAGISYGRVQVDWVYNSMPPVPGQIYPPMALEAVREF